MLVWIQKTLPQNKKQIFKVKLLYRLITLATEIKVKPPKYRTLKEVSLEGLCYVWLSSTIVVMHNT